MKWKIHGTLFLKLQIPTIQYEEWVKAAQKECLEAVVGLWFGSCNDIQKMYGKYTLTTAYE